MSREQACRFPFNQGGTEGRLSRVETTQLSKDTEPGGGPLFPSLRPGVCGWTSPRKIGTPFLLPPWAHFSPLHLPHGLLCPDPRPTTSRLSSPPREGRAPESPRPPLLCPAPIPRALLWWGESGGSQRDGCPSPSALITDPGREAMCPGALKRQGTSSASQLPVCLWGKIGSHGLTALIPLASHEGGRLLDMECVAFLRWPEAGTSGGGWRVRMGCTGCTECQALPLDSEHQWPRGPANTPERPGGSLSCTGGGREAGLLGV